MGERVVVAVVGVGGEAAGELHRRAVGMDGGVVVVEEVKGAEVVVFVGGGAAGAVACARAGVHAVVTGMGGVAGAEWEAVSREVKALGVVVAVARPVFGWAALKKMDGLVRAGAIGRVRQGRVVCAAEAGETVADGLAVAAAALDWATGLRAREVAGDIATVNRLGHFLMRCEEKARVVVSVSAGVAAPGVLVEVDGEGGTLRWSQDRPEDLHTDTGAERRVMTVVERMGELGALASVYRGVLEAVRARREGRARRGVGREFVGAADLARAARLVEAGVRAAGRGFGWGWGKG